MIPFSSKRIAINRPFIKFFTRGKVVPQDPISEFQIAPDQTIIYVIPHDSIADLILLQRACAKLSLPDPATMVTIGGKEYSRVSYLHDKQGNTNNHAIEQFTHVLQAQANGEANDALLMPVKCFWDRYPGQETVADLASETTAKYSLPPSTWKRALQVIFKGRESLVRFSHPVSMKEMAERQGHDQRIGHKLARVARIHFSRMMHIATGPKLPNRRLMFQQLLGSKVIREAIKTEAADKAITEQEARQTALKYLDEIGANFSYKNLRFLEIILSWVWQKIYSGIEVNHAEKVRQLAQEGNEIVFTPCHRSHMDYLLLSYVLYHQGMVPPHIAAGVNLNFWPAGPIFRRSGAFFIRRSFKGNKLYATVFKEYLSLLFNKGYSVEFFTEGGRSRTGRLLPPKTGMLSMTLQTVADGLDRPVTIVPIYFGYDHVMEVGTYYNELRGQKKQKESLFSALGIIRKLRNFGVGYVNFGEPIQVNQSLKKIDPEWREKTVRNEKPEWLNPAIDDISTELMQNINSAVAVNGLCLASTILLSTDRKALPQSQLLQQMELYLSMLRSIPYSNNITIPEGSAFELLEQAKSLGKFEIDKSGHTDIFSLNSEQQVLLNFYRNNIIHTMIIPSLIASMLLRTSKPSLELIQDQLSQIYPIIKQELFIHLSDAEAIALVESYLSHFVTAGLIKLEAGRYKPIATQRNKLALLSQSCQESLHRYAIMLHLLARPVSMDAEELEAKALTGAQDFAKIHNIDAPEFYDHKIVSGLYQWFSERGYAEPEQAKQLSGIIMPLLPDGSSETIQDLLG